MSKNNHVAVKIDSTIRENKAAKIFTKSPVLWITHCCGVLILLYSSFMYELTQYLDM